MENGLTPSNSFEMQSSLTAIPPKPYTGENHDTYSFFTKLVMTKPTLRYTGATFFEGN